MKKYRLAPTCTSPRALPTCLAIGLGRVVGLAIGLVIGVGCGDDAAQHLRPLGEGPEVHYAVKLSDFSSTAIALLDAEGEVIDPSWIHSGTVVPGLVAALSGDVVLPSTPSPGALTLIDRYRTDVVTRIDLGTGKILGQLRVTEPPSASSAHFSANPYDVVVLPVAERALTSSRLGSSGAEQPHTVSKAAPSVASARAWVTRFGVLPASDAGGELGNDLLEFDPRSMTLTDRRIPLGAFNTSLPPSVTGLPTSTEVFARPSLALAVGRHILVALARLSLGFDVAADGMVVALDPDSDHHRSATLDGLSNCGRAVKVDETSTSAADANPNPNPDADATVPESPRATRVLVACSGFSRPFSEPVALRRTAGLVFLRVGDGQLDVDTVWRAADHPDTPLAVEGAVPVGGHLVVATAFGHAPGEPDRLYTLDLATGATSLLLEARKAYDLGQPTFDARSGLLLVPDASEGLRRFRLAAARSGAHGERARGADSDGAEVEDPDGPGANTETPAGSPVFSISSVSWEALASLRLGVDEGLPPREVYRLR